VIENSPQAPPAKLIRQFQTLTHPAMMGNKFSVLECTKNRDSDSTVLAKLELSELND
jgi:SAM-dependent MidA family methyltransferase